MSRPDSTVTLYHNPNCSKSRGALALLEEETGKRGLTLEVCEYLQQPPDTQALSEIIRLLPNPPAELVRNDKNFKALELTPEDYTTGQQVQTLLLEHPALMQRPIAIHRDKAVIGRPPEDILELF